MSLSLNQMCLVITVDISLRVIPKGFAHGYAVLSEEAIFQYKCDEFYHPESEGGIAWNDPMIGIDWKLPINEITLSDKDRKHRTLNEIIDNKLF